MPAAHDNGSPGRSSTDKWTTVPWWGSNRGMERSCILLGCLNRSFAVGVGSEHHSLSGLAGSQSRDLGRTHPGDQEEREDWRGRVETGKWVTTGESTPTWWKFWSTCQEYQMLVFCETDVTRNVCICPKNARCKNKIYQFKNNMIYWVITVKQ